MELGQIFSTPAPASDLLKTDEVRPNIAASGGVVGKTDGLEDVKPPAEEKPAEPAPSILGTLSAGEVKDESKPDPVVQAILEQNKLLANFVTRDAKAEEEKSPLDNINMEGFDEGLRKSLQAMQSEIKRLRKQSAQAAPETPQPVAQVQRPTLAQRAEEARNFLMHSMPHYLKHDTDPGFHKYLDTQIELTGQTVRSVLEKAVADGNNWQVANIYKKYDEQTMAKPPSGVQADFTRAAQAPNIPAEQSEAQRHLKTVTDYLAMGSALKTGLTKDGKAVTDEDRNTAFMKMIEASARLQEMGIPIPKK